MEVYRALLIGILIGLVIAGIILRPLNSSGTLVIDESDPDSPYLFLESDEPLSSLMKHKRVVYRVERRSYIPPK